MKMKKLAGLLAGGALLLSALPVLAGKASKVEICHTTDSLDVLQNEFTTVVGHRINISEKALVAHQAHGDLVFTDNNDIEYGPVIFGLTWRQVANNLGLNLENVNCAGFVLDF